MQNKIQYTNFTLRYFKKDFVGTNLSHINQDELLEFINSNYNDIYPVDLDDNDIELLDSLYDFCKYLVIPLDNEYKINCSVKRIEQSDYQFIKSDYSSRTETELDVISRRLEIPKIFSQPKSKYLVVILYTKEQLLKEHDSTDKNIKFELNNDCEYGIVSLMGTIEPYPDSITPITMMRNALGKKYGGNGVKINFDEYNKSVNFWKYHILIK